ncbi:MAG: hypothetical protein H6557_06290 [Lewinellaceae bacterium]|nr:hypothetical protein [Phaeodactylibacter sp.]MCB9036215.1 hypothetical protein [Lewinellaceae bacterium]
MPDSAGFEFLSVKNRLRGKKECLCLSNDGKQREEISRLILHLSSMHETGSLKNRK